MVALWLQKIVKSKRIDGINVKPQQDIDALFRKSSALIIFEKTIAMQKKIMLA